MKVILVIITIIFIVVIIYKIIRFKRNLNLKRIFYSNICRFPSFGAYVSISGALGAGKTILLYAMSHLATCHYIMDLNQRMNDISLLLPEFPFKRYTNLFMSLKYSNPGVNYDDLFNEFEKRLKVRDNYYLYLLHENLFDYHKTRSKINMIKKYYYYFNESIRSNHVYSNIEIFNHINAEYSYQFKSSWFHIKDNDTFPIPDFSFIAYDEASIDKSNKNAVSKLNEDTGVDIVERLLRNASEESMFYYTTVQDVSRLLAFERELFTSNIHVIASYMVGQSRLYMKWIEFLERLNNSLEKIYKFLFLKKVNKSLFEDSNNYFRRKSKKLELKQKKHLSKTYVMFEVAVYSKVENIGKKITEELEDKGNFYYTIAVPQQYAYGAGSSFTFAPFFKYLRERSKLKPDNIGRTTIDADYIESLLSKHKKSNTSTLGPSSSSYYDPYEEVTHE